MGEATKIEWCHHTFNPWWGCARVSPGCEHCYAETFAKRVGQKVWGTTAERRFFGDKHWAEPLKWNRLAAEAGERRRVFCASMADVFEDRPDLEQPRARLFDLIQETTHLDWLLLTKRPGEALRWFGGSSGAGLSAPPIPNLWLGVTAEDQRRAEERIPLLEQIPAAVRFVSYEPALGPVDFQNMFFGGCGDCDPCLGLPGIEADPRQCHAPERVSCLHPDGVTWVIVGGESGPGSRPFDVAWARSAVEQCRDAGVACFVKQLGAMPIEERWDRDQADHWPQRIDLDDRKGGDPSEWPEDLRVRGFPRVPQP